ncbi:hypothetical protein SAMN03080594_107160 [Arenibacter palladensis]|uniref:Chaperone of endosialidase n=1 Tax=Arenibacter palladensis TaxID=237373 RepID=A0A1M5EJP8_9FLAO|nr:hypothetical protein [Arenibacter palladensis]SHF79396.1 hypothetical protein SAMN03080594_107160 [Arenibacter palladensis]
MKRKYIAPLAFLFVLYGYSQGNYYPASGNVGIGTLTPNYNLEVAGSFSATEIFVNGALMQSSPWSLSGVNTFYNAGRVGIGTNNPGYALDVSGTVNASNLLINGAPLPESPWSLSGSNTFYNAGRVGIGTNNPGFALDVAGTVNATNLLINGAPLPGSPWSLSGVNTFYNAGRVGIGTNNPGFALDVAGTVNATNLLINGAPLPASPWSVSGSETYYISGNVGIGTNNPNFDLDVDGTINANSILINGTLITASPWTVSGTNVYYNAGGRVGIGITNVPNGYALAVDGNVLAEEIRVELSQNWPDFVFTKNYDLPTLKEVERHILEKGHLENIPSAAEVRLNGIMLGEMNAKLLQKIEELTLYIIDQQKEIEELKHANSKFENEKDGLKILTSRLEKLEKYISEK